MPLSRDLSGLAWGQAAGDPEFAPGDRLDSYRLMSLLGEGGFGLVYLAEQEEPVRRKVAVKLIKPGMDTRQVVARFQAERQAMALMDHPGVARIYDAGTTPAGRPYFVMEYVRGEPITEYCDMNRLNVTERLRLFLEVCEAVQYAHQKGFIHRDIKPSNILVTTDGPRPQPKVIDWGVAKATQRDEESRTMMTEMGQFVGTPEYMSPEQADLGPGDVDTRSDIYSLGVVLYQLLCGELPFESKVLRQGSYFEVQRAIAQSQPTRPSVKFRRSGHAGAIAGRRRVSGRVLVRMLRDDLDWIVMKAMDKERSRRYASAAELAADLRRHLTNEAVLAGAPSRGYRARKFVKRHRAGVAVAAGVLGLLVSGSALVSVLYYRARGAGAQARETAEREAAARRLAEFRAYLRDVDAAHRAMEGDAARAWGSLVRAGRDGRALADWELAYLEAQFDGSAGAWRPAEGRVTAVADGGGGAALVGVDTGTLVRLDASGEAIGEAAREAGRPVRIAAGGGVTAALSRDGLVRCWGEDGAALCVIDPLGEVIEALAVRGDGEFVATIGEEGAIRLWGTRTGGLAAEFWSRTMVFTAAAFVHEDVLLGTSEGEVVRWTPGMAQVREVARGEGVVSCVAARGDEVAAGFEDGMVMIAGPGGVVRVQGHRGGVRAVAFGDKGLLVSAGEDWTGAVWERGREVCRLRGHSGVVAGASWVGGRVVTSAEDGSARVWDVESIRARHTSERVAAGRASEMRRVSEGWVRIGGGMAGVKGSAPSGEAGGAEGDRDGGATASEAGMKAEGYPDGSVWVGKEGERGATLSVGGPVSGLAFLPGAKRIAAGTRDGQVAVFDCATGERVLTLREEGPAVEGLCVVSQSLIGAFADGTVAAWSARREERLMVKAVAGEGSWIGDAFVCSEDGRRGGDWVRVRLYATGNASGRVVVQAPELLEPLATRVESFRAGASAERLLGPLPRGKGTVRVEWWADGVEAPSVFEIER